MSFALYRQSQFAPATAAAEERKMILWKMLVVGSFTLHMGQPMDFNGAQLHQEMDFFGTVGIETTGFKSEQDCKVQLAAVPNTFVVSKVAVTVKRKDCVKDLGPQA
jgi:hypothetical protein